DADDVFPAYYDGKWFITEWLRGWIHVISLDDEGNFEWMEQFLPDENFNGPLDMMFGPDGSLYVLAYGKGWFKANEEAGIIRIRYNGGNRAPKVVATSDKKAGKIPLNVNFSSDGTIDFDNDNLTYRWNIRSKAGNTITTMEEPNPSFTFKDSGIYNAELTVRDEKGASNSQSIEIVAGNDPPVIEIRITEGNSSFYFPGVPTQYKVKIRDTEDGSLVEGGIHDSLVTVNIDYLSEGYDPALLKEGHPEQGTDIQMDLRVPMMINASDCYSCHELEGQSIGPSFKKIAERYETNQQNIEMLADKTINGGAGNWGNVAMSAHPALDQQEAELMAEYILNLDETVQERDPSKPVHGSFTPKKLETNGKGIYLLRASYTDRGNNDLPRLTSNDRIIFKNPTLSPLNADQTKGFMKVPIANKDEILYFLHGNGAYLKYEELDITGISTIHIQASPSMGGYFEIRAGTPKGELLGTSEGEETNSYKINIKPSTGKIDLFLIAQNDTAEYHQILFQVDSLKLLQGQE
ncbi:MAG: PKD domain-containing protein, partial [Balneolaceae bacterium]|nr:PKD domain-containing protein [Balneolaceae bacterium]